MFALVSMVIHRLIHSFLMSFHWSVFVFLFRKFRDCYFEFVFIKITVDPVTLRFSFLLKTGSVE